MGDAWTTKESLIVMAFVTGIGIAGYYVFSDTGCLIGGIVGLVIGAQVIKSNRGENKTERKEIDPYVGSGFSSGQKITTHVVGVSFENRQYAIEKLKIDDELSLFREYENSYDRNAIKVIAVGAPLSDDAWRRSEMTGNPIENLSEKEDIGYINKELAKKIAPIFGEYAQGPNQYVHARIVNITKREGLPNGVEIEFALPTKWDYERAIMELVHFRTY